MLRKSTILALAGSLLMTGAALAGTFGKVVPIGGAAADVALDEARGKLYVANFTGRRIDVMSLATNTITTSISVAAQPSSLAVSPDGRWLLIAHYGNNTAPASPTNNITVIDLRNNNSKQTFALANPPLGLAFGIDNKALIVTTKDFISFDPSLGTTQVITTITEQATKAIPQPAQSAPAQFSQASVGASADGRYIWGFADSLLFKYQATNHIITAGYYTASPIMAPRVVSVANDGSRAAMGWWMMDLYNDYPRPYAQFPEPLGDLALGGHQIDSARGLIYSEVPRLLTDAPMLTVRDIDNLTVRERLQLAEHLAGRSVMTTDGATMYASSASGVTVLPVGKLNTVPRLEASVEDLSFQGNFCDRDAATQSFIVRDPGGAKVPFTISSSNSGVRLTPSSGVTPAVIKVTVDPNAFAAQKGTVAVTLTITSDTAVNAVNSVRVLVNSREPDQRGTFINSPGKLVDLVADPAKDQYYVLRQDKNQVLVYDGANNTVKATLRTCSVPRGMAISYDRRYLMVGCKEGRTVSVFDLETLQPSTSITTRNANIQSIAATAHGILAVGFDHSSGDWGVYSLDMNTRTGDRLPTLGVWENKVPENTVVTAASNGASALIASPDGSLFVYDSNVNTFTVSRKDFTTFAGAYAASSFGDYVIGNQLFNSSGVPVRLIQPTNGVSSGFTFVDQNGYFVTASDATSAGVISKVDAPTGLGFRPTRFVEAPILPTDLEPFTRTVAPLYSRGSIIALTVSGITVLPSGYDASVVSPNIARVVSAADGVSAIAPGGLFSIYGTNLSPTNVATKEIPLPTALGDSCLTVNGQPVPIIFVSPGQINGQMPYQTVGNVTLIVHTPGGVSDNYNLTVPATAPAIFRAEVTPGAAFPTVVRAANNLMATDTNPVHRNDVLVIYLTGLGKVSPFVENGRPAPSDPLATTVAQPEVNIGGIGAPVLFSGLAPGQVGLYQLNVTVPGNAPKGLGIPLNIVANGVTHTVNVRVVE
ncbi:MAG: cytochrome D1 domain-containing protein [Bryobacteraceae bacterium]